MTILDGYSVEWNEEQGCFHCESVETRWASSCAHYLKGHSRGAWVTLGVLGSHAEAHKFIATLEDARAEYENKSLTG